MNRVGCVTLSRGQRARESWQYNYQTRGCFVVRYGSEVALYGSFKPPRYCSYCTAVSDQFPTTTEPAKTLEALAG